MSGPFGDSSDANRKPRGPRPFAGQMHPPGSGPLKSSRVRRPTLAPFPSLAEPELRGAAQAPVQPSAPQADSPLMLPAELQRELVSEARAQPEPDAPAIDAYGYEDPIETPMDEFAGSDADAAAFAVPDSNTEAPDPFTDVDQESYAETFTDPEVDSAERTAEWSVPGDDDDRPQSALHTEELRERDLEAREPSEDAGDSLVESGASGDEDDWFSQTGDASTADDVADAPFDSIDSVGETLRSLTASEGAEGAHEPPPVSLPVDWAVSSEGEADLQAYVAEVRIREEASDVLEGVARRVRSGEIVLALEPGASTEAVLASVLASLLT